MKLYKGIGRSEGDWTEGNDLGLIFATVNIATARYYSDWGNEGAGVVGFEASADNVANLNDRATAEEIVEYIGADEALIDDLVANRTGDHIGIMDDFDTGFANAVFELGYAGATQDGDYCLFASEIEITNIQEII